MVDPSELVRIRPQPADDFGDDIANGRLFWQCESYDEYRLHCTIEGVEPLFTREEFENLRQPGSFSLDGLAEVSQRYGVNISTMLGLAEEECCGINL